MEMTFSPALLRGAAPAPASKSEAHRRMLCAGLTAGETRLAGFMPSADMTATLACLSALGARWDVEDDILTLHGMTGTGERLPMYDCGESGSTLRFFVPIALALTGGGVFRMHGRLGSRPMDVYRDLFVPRGVQWGMHVGADGAAELTVAGTLQPGDYVLPGKVSSQFVSGLLFALPLLQGDSTLAVTPPVESVSYIRMTVDALRGSGIQVEDVADHAWRIPGGQRYQAESGRLEGDWSQAAVLLCADALGAEVAVTGLSAETSQGDRAVLGHLQALGCEISEKDGAVTVSAPNGLHGAVLDMRNTPDIAPALAVVCQLAEGDSQLTGCARLRLKECDRLSATVQLLNALGGDAEEGRDTLTIHGVKGLRGGVKLSGCNDHRMVMAASIAALRADGPVTVTGAEALNKSWPGYPALYRALGGQAEEA